MPARSQTFFQYLSYVAFATVLGYVLGWTLAWWPGNAELFLTCVTVFCGVYWLLDKCWWSRVRAKEHIPIIQAYQNRWRDLDEEHARTEDPQMLASVQVQRNILDEDLQEQLAPPLWISNTAGCFMVLLTVWAVRSFLWEPFYVPSGSMTPTLRTGDAIAVNKWEEGLRVPGTNIWLTGPNLVRGAPIVFQYPEDPNIHFIKRIVALEGDTVVYKDKTVLVNGHAYKREKVAPDALKDLQLGEELVPMDFFVETTSAGVSYATQVEASHVSMFEPTAKMEQAWPNACVHDGSTVACKVPAKHAFVLGDNRDNSLDSRYWGFVPYDSIKGTATRYLFNARDLGTSRWLEEIK